MNKAMKDDPISQPSHGVLIESSITDLWRHWLARLSHAQVMPERILEDDDREYKGSLERD